MFYTNSSFVKVWQCLSIPCGKNVISKSGGKNTQETTVDTCKRVTPADWTIKSFFQDLVLEVEEDVVVKDEEVEDSEEEEEEVRPNLLVMLVCVLQGFTGAL